MRQEFIQRQIALVSYGTQFLRKKVALEEWYRHGIFFGARLQFRDAADNSLLADDFTLWLGHLTRTGATRLSLHLAAELEIEASQTYVIAVQYPDRYQVWAVGEERPAWLDHPLLPDDAGFQVLPNAAAYAGDVDCYRCIEERAGELAVAGTDWRELASAIAADLDIPVPSSAVPVGPCRVGSREGADWADMPLFVAADPASHRVLATLYRELAKFENETHMKNENSAYHQADAAGRAAIDHWGERLKSWISEVHLRCANDGGATAAGAGPLRRRQAAPLPLQPVPAGDAVQDLPAATTKQAMGKWTGRIALIVGIGMLSFFILAFARIIAHFPWVAIVIALPWALYMHYKD